ARDVRRERVGAPGQRAAAAAARAGRAQARRAVARGDQRLPRLPRARRAGPPRGALAGVPRAPAREGAGDHGPLGDLPLLVRARVRRAEPRRRRCARPSDGALRRARGIRRRARPGGRRRPARQPPRLLLARLPGRGRPRDRLDPARRADLRRQPDGIAAPRRGRGSVIPIVVVDTPGRWLPDLPDAQVVDARDYLLDPRYSEIRNVTVFNLCRTYGY